MENKKIYSGSEISALAVKNAFYENNILYIEKNEISSGVIAGFGTLDKAIHIFVSENDYEKALKIISELNVS